MVRRVRPLFALPAYPEAIGQGAAMPRVVNPQSGADCIAAYPGVLPAVPAASGGGTRDRAMLAGKKIIVVLPAYNAAKTLQQTYAEIPHDVVDEVLLVDDASSDDTAALAQALGIPTLRHDRNRGYGGNQKTCYTAALARGADIVVMLHPDYQYAPQLVTAMASMIASGHYDVVLGSRILGGGARQPPSRCRGAVRRHSGRVPATRTDRT
jgi:hypothetical protein